MSSDGGKDAAEEVCTSLRSSAVSAGEACTGVDEGWVGSNLLVFFHLHAFTQFMLTMPFTRLPARIFLNHGVRFGVSLLGVREGSQFSIG
jgi:hypothetical protein